MKEILNAGDLNSIMSSRITLLSELNNVKKNEPFLSSNPLGLPIECCVLALAFKLSVQEKFLPKVWTPGLVPPPALRFRGSLTFP